MTIIVIFCIALFVFKIGSRNASPSPSIIKSADEPMSVEEATELGIPIVKGYVDPTDISDDTIITTINGKNVTYDMLKSFNEIINSTNSETGTQSDLYDPKTDGEFNPVPTLESDQINKDITENFTVEEMKQVVSEYKNLLE